MRRSRGALVMAIGAAAAAAGAGFLGSPTRAQDHAEVEVTGVSVHACSAPRTCRAAPAFAIRPGGRYSVRIHYTLAGPAEVKHLFTFQNQKGENRTIRGAGGGDLAHHSAARKVEPGDRREEVRVIVPGDWEPGVYRVSYEVTVKMSDDEHEEVIPGARSVLVLPPRA